MRALYRMDGSDDGMKVRIVLPPSSVYEYRVSPEREEIIVCVDDFEELASQIREGDSEKAELKRALDRVAEALGVAQVDNFAARLVERAEWVVESRDYWEAEETRTRREAEALLAADDVDDLKATIVSQAREISRLKGDSA